MSCDWKSDIFINRFLNLKYDSILKQTKLANILPDFLYIVAYFLIEWYKPTTTLRAPPPILEIAWLSRETYLVNSGSTTEDDYNKLAFIVIFYKALGSHVRGYSQD